jgi:hypothetical protein
LLNFRNGDLEVIATSLQTTGVRFEKRLAQAKDGSKSALIRDPDGNAIYLVSHPVRL